MALYRASACSRCYARIWSRPDGQDQCGRCKSGYTGKLSTCEICLEDVRDPVKYSRIANESWENRGCEHSGKFCRGCMQKHLQSQLDSCCWNVRCPSVRCQYSLVEADFKLVLGTGSLTQVGTIKGKGKGTTECIHNKTSDADPDSDDNLLQSEECQRLLEKYRALRTADYGTHLRAVLATQRQNRTHVGEETVRDVAERKGEAGACENAFNELSLEPGFGDWVLGQCQACPRCLVIIRKEVGCDQIVCMCGAGFCYGCGAPSNTNASGCLCKTSLAKDTPHLGRWLEKSDPTLTFNVTESR